MTKKIGSSSFLVTLSLILLASPNINIIDPLPDCLAYFVLLYVIGKKADTVPYLIECRDALVKLLFITLLKIPAFIIMYSNIETGRDIIPMFTLIFVTLETIYICIAIINGAKALGYIGERTEAAIAAAPFKTGLGKGTMTPESLKALTFAFFIARGTLNLLPELCLLTPEETELRRKLSEMYPSALIVCILAALACGIIWCYFSSRYVKALNQTDELSHAIEALNSYETPEEQKNKSALKNLLGALGILAASSLFCFDFRFSDLGNVDILPDFIYGIVLFYAIFKLSSKPAEKVTLSVTSGLFTLGSIISNIASSRFFERYDYINILYITEAKKAYVPVKICSVIETIMLLCVLLASAIILSSFIKEKTAISPSDPAYSRMSLKTHNSLITRSSLLFAFSCIIAILKCVNVFLNGMVKLEFTSISDEGFATGALPWMSTLIFGLCVFFVIYSFYFISELKNEVKFKYSDK